MQIQMLEENQLQFNLTTTNVADYTADFDFMSLVNTESLLSKEADA